MVAEDVSQFIGALTNRTTENCIKTRTFINCSELLRRSFVTFNECVGKRRLAGRAVCLALNQTKGETKMSTTGQTNQETPDQQPPGGNQEHLRNLADEASATLNDVKEQGAEQYEHLRDMATDQLDSLVEGAQSAASALEGKDTLGLSQYLGQLASGLGSFADQVRDKSAEDLLHTGARLARDNPALFLAGSVAVGFGLSRFLRASASHASNPASPPTSTSTGVTASTPPASDFGADEPYQTSVTPLASQRHLDQPPLDSIADPLGEAATYPGTSTVTTPVPGTLPKGGL